MTHPENGAIDAAAARAFLAAHFDPAVTDVELVGAGAWSRAFGFRRGADALVARFGRHVDDFEQDRRASAYCSADLPVPEVLAIGEAPGGYYAVSRRVYGVPLESLDAAGWEAVFPSLVAALEAIRRADISGTTGYGGAGADGNAPFARWSEHILAVGSDTPDRRTHGWRARLREDAERAAVFDRGYALLAQVVDDSAPRSLIHADLINRNVLVDGERISGVFDWGCTTYGDHLYELAWFEFWSPWYPELDVAQLRAALERRWRDAGYAPHNQSARLLACHLHIGLDHLAYNAYLGDWPTLAQTAERMRALAGGRL
jgi:hygromycin-B 4-O-kinase